MARREKQRKTSLGNVLESQASKSDVPELPTPTRWRSASESSAQPQPKARLFGSVREAMEFEAAEEEVARRAADNKSSIVVATTRPLDARALSTLEKTQADEAGYTVIRRRAVSEPAEASREQQQQQQQQQQRRRAGGGDRSETTERRHRGGRATRERRESAGGDNSRAGAVATSTRRPTKRASMNAARGATSNVWALTSAKPADADPAHEAASSDEQRWLAAASAGAVFPARVSPPTTQASVPWAAAATAGAPSAWSSSSSAVSMPATLTEPAATASSQLPSEGGVHPLPPTPGEATPVAPAAVLDESMLSWLESALALDATRAASSPTAANDARNVNSKDDPSAL